MSSNEEAFQKWWDAVLLLNRGKIAPQFKESARFAWEPAYQAGYQAGLAASGVGEWQPIDSCPIDGTRFLIGTPEFVNIAIGTAEFVNIPFVQGGVIRDWGSDDQWEAEDVAIGWMPLPEAPKMKIRGQKVHPPQERIKRMVAVNPNTSCWEWKGTTNNGYGRMSAGSRGDDTRHSAKARSEAADDNGGAAA